MKKLFAFLALFATICLTAQGQQTEAGQAQKLQAFKQQVKPLLMQKVSLSDAAADKVITIHFSYAGRMDRLAGLQEEEKTKLTEELVAAETKEYMALPLTSVQIKTVRELFEKQKRKTN